MTAQSRNYILRNYKEKTIQEMADTLKRPYNQVWKWMKQHGLLEVKHPDYEKPPYRGILNMYINGWYLEDIAEQTGCTRNFCRNVIHRIFRTYSIPERAAINASEPDGYTNPQQGIEQ